MRARRYGTGCAAPAASGAHQCPCPTVGDEVGLPGAVVGRCRVAEALTEAAAAADAVVGASAAAGVALVAAAVPVRAPDSDEGFGTAAFDAWADCDGRAVETAPCGAEKGIRLFGATGPPSRLQTTITA
jgi:hypothetical protein